MNYYKSPDNGIHALDDAAHEGLLPAGSVQITDVEARALCAPGLEAQFAHLVAAIDGDVDAIYAAVVGNRYAEYERANREAAAYRDAGYTGEVPPSVQTWVDAKADPAKDAKWAADDILAVAAAWEQAQVQIRAARLSAKEQARSAAGPDELQAARAAWEQARSAIRTALGLEA